MARIARVIAPGCPHHITQRGNRRQEVFFCDGDYHAYLELMATWCTRCEVDILAWCLMPNHVHLIAVPHKQTSLARAIGEAHRRYTRMINLRQKWRGHLWQERFASFPMDERHLLAAARYIETNPVAAKLVRHPEDYRWSSVHAHVNGRDDILTKVAPLLELVDDWREFLKLPAAEDVQKIQQHERTGRPLGGERFVTRLEKAAGRVLRPRKPGPKPTNR